MVLQECVAPFSVYLQCYNYFAADRDDLSRHLKDTTVMLQAITANAETAEGQSLGILYLTYPTVHPFQSVRSRWQVS